MESYLLMSTLVYIHDIGYSITVKIIMTQKENKKKPITHTLHKY